MGGGDVATAGSLADAAPIFCCPGCGIVYDILHGGSAGSSSPEGAGGVPPALVLRFGVAAFLAFNIMVFSLFHYGEGVYGATHGFAPEAVRDFFRWMVFGLAVPAVWLLAAPQVRAIRAAGSGLGRAYHALVLVSVGAAMVVSVHAVLTGGESIYFDTAVMLLLLVTLGQLIEGYLRTRAARRLDDLLAGGHARWRVVRAGAEEGSEPVEIAPEEIGAGDRFVLRPGDRMPVDGRVVGGRSETDTECRDGELLPSPRGPGDAVRSGELNLTNPLEVVAEPSAEGPWWLRFCGMARGAFARGARSERLAARIAATLLPTTMGLATATFAMWWWAERDTGHALLVALSVLVVACPCAMGLATPVALRLAVGEALRLGAMPRDAGALERLAAIDHVVVDYTGTMTVRAPDVVAVRALAGEGAAEPDAAAIDALRPLLAALTAQSRHPVAAAVGAWARAGGAGGAGGGDVDRRAPHVALEDVREVRGKGLAARTSDGAAILLGQRAWLVDEGIVVPSAAPREGRVDGDGVGARGGGGGGGGGNGGGGGEVLVARDGRAVAAFDLDVPLHPTTAAALEALTRLGVGVSLLTGAATAPTLPEGLARRLASVRARCAPEDKLAAIAVRRAAGERVAMIGDGLNDLPALHAADLGIAAGGLDAATEAVADIVLTQPGLGTLPALMRLARRTRRVLALNFVWLIGYNSIALSSAVAGLLHPLLAATLMVLSSMVSIGNSFTIRPVSPFAGAPRGDETTGPQGDAPALVAAGPAA